MADPNEAGGWVVDPRNPNRATYTDPDTGETLEAFKEAQQAAPAQQPEMTGVERIWANARTAAQEGFGGQVAQKWYDWTNYGHDQLRQQFPKATDEEIESMADRLIAQARRQVANDVQKKLDADPTWKPDASYWDNTMRTINNFTGGLIGSSDPTMLIAPGKNAIQRMGAQGVVSGAADAGYQSINIAEGYKEPDEFDLAQVGMNTLFGVGGQGFFEIPGFVRGLFEKRGKNTTPDASPARVDSPAMSNEPLRPEVLDEWDQLQATGSAQDMIDFFKRENRMVDASVIDRLNKYVEARDAGGPVTSGQVYSDPVEGGLNVPAARDSVADLGTALDQAQEIAVTGTKARPSAKLLERAQTQVVNRVNDLTSKWQNAPEFEVHQSFRDLPDLDANAIGVTTPEGKVLLNVENIAGEAKARGVNPDDIISAVTFHEGLGHHGLSQKFGEELDSILENLYARAPSFQKEVDAWMSKNPDAYAEDINPLARAAEEVFAGRSEAGKIDPSLMERFRAWLRQTARKMGLDLDFNDNEIKVILGMAHNATVNGKPRDVAGNGFRYSNPVDEEADLNRVLGTRPQPERIDYPEPTELGPLPDDGARMPLSSLEQGRGMDERQTTKYNKQFWRDKQNQEVGVGFKEVGRSEDGTVSLEYRDTDGGKPIPMRMAIEPDGTAEISIDPWGESKNRLGPAKIRQAMLDLANQYPEIKSFGGFRRSGSGAGRVQEVALKKVVQGVNRYMRTSGKGSEGSLQGGSRKEGDQLGLGSFRSKENLSDILAENAPEPTKQSWNDWIDEANSVRSLVKAHKKLDTGSDPAQVLAAREAIIKSANRIATLSRKAADGNLTEREQYQLFAEMARNADMQDALAGVRSNAARIVNSFKINVETDASFTDAIRNMMRSVDNTVFSDPENRQKLFEVVANAANDQTAVNRIVKNALRPKAEEFVFRLWYNMLLSSPATHSANFLGTGMNFAYDLLENTGAALMGQGKRFSNADRVRGREVIYRVYGALRALKDAQTWSNTRKALNTGQTGGTGNSKAGSSNVYTGDNKALGFASGVVEAPTRALAGADEWWRNVLQLSNMHGLAVRNAGNKGLKGKEFWSEVDNLINNPTKEMIEATNDYTKVLQFLDKASPIGKALINLQTPKPDSTVPGRVARGVLKAAVPFVNTPDALIRTAIRRSGVLTPFERENVKGWRAGGAERDKVKARMAMGSALAFWIATQAYQGNITGSGPADYKKKQEWLGSHQENSIKVGDKWISIAGLEPVSTNINAVATLVERLKNGEINLDDYGKSALVAAQGLGSVLTENSYLEGFNNLMDVNDADPNKAQTAATNFIAGLTSSAVPAIVRQYARAEDPALRDTTGDGSLSDRIEGRFDSSLPGKTEELPQRYDVYGRPMSRDTAGPDMLLRTLQRGEETDPAIRELARLGDSTNKIVLGAPGKSNIKVNGVEKRLTAEEFQKYQQLSGYWIVETVRQEMQTPEWQSMSDAEKIDLVKDITKDMREQARDLLFNPDNDEQEEEPEGE